MNRNARLMLFFCCTYVLCSAAVIGADLCIFKKKPNTSNLCSTSNSKYCYLKCTGNRLGKACTGTDEEPRYGDYYTGNWTQEVESGGTQKILSVERVVCFRRFRCRENTFLMTRCTSLLLVKLCLTPDPSKNCFSCVREDLALLQPNRADEANLVRLEDCPDE